MSELAQKIASLDGRGFVEAPAGFGKTHLISQVVSCSDQKVLILTHTYAGVNSLRLKLTNLGVPSSTYELSTLDSWSLRFCLAYPQTSNWQLTYPTDGESWRELRQSILKLLGQSFVQKIITASYDLILVDEYQDCSTFQHSLVSKISELIPCCVIGDPLQGIFDFADEPVNWEVDIYPYFEKVGELTIPWRWKEAGNEELGAWIRMLRTKLEANEDFDIRRGVPSCVRYFHASNPGQLRKVQATELTYFKTAKGESIIGIYDGKSGFRTHTMARNTGGRFTSIEEIEGKRLKKLILDYERVTSPKDKLLAAIEMAKKCLSKVNENLSAATKRGEFTKIRAKTKNPIVVLAANQMLENPNANNLRHFLQQLSLLENVEKPARDLFNRLVGVLTTCVNNPDLGILEALEAYSTRFRHLGRPLNFSRQIGTTLLVKGLEYDHAVVLDASQLDRKQLYVALSRATKSMKIISTTPLLPAI